MRMKKWISLLLTAGMLLSLAACGAEPESSVGSETAETTAVTMVEEPFRLELSPEQVQARQAADEVTFAAIDDGEIFTVVRSDGKLIPFLLQSSADANYNLGTLILRGHYNHLIEKFLLNYPKTIEGLSAAESIKLRMLEFVYSVQQGNYLGYVSDIADTHAEEDIAAMESGEQYDILYGELCQYYRESRSEADSFARVWRWEDIVDACSLPNVVFGLDSQGKIHAEGYEKNSYQDALQWTDIVDIASLSNTLVGLRSDGTVVATGQDSSIRDGVKSWSKIQQIHVSANSCLGIRENGIPVVAGFLKNKVDLNLLKGASSFAVGPTHVLGLFPDGTVAAAPCKDLESLELNYGQCAVEEWTDIVAIAAGAVSSFGLKSDGTVVVCGGFDDTDEFRDQIGDLTDVESLQAGTDSTDDKLWGTKKDGSVFFLDTMGTGTQKQQYAQAWRNVYKVTAGNAHVLGLKSDGTAAAYGYNSYGQCDVEGWIDLVDAEAGTEHSLGLKSDGTAVAVGNNEYGACNVDGWSDLAHIAANSGSVGVRSDGSTLCVSVTVKLDDFSRKKIVQVGATYKGSYGVCEDGSVVFAGELNNYESLNREWCDIVAIAADLPCGLKSDGTLQLHSTYVLDYDLSDWTDIAAIVADGTSILGIRKDGTVAAAWNEGNMHYGEFEVSDWTDITALDIGSSHTLGLKSDGTVVAVGRNDDDRCNVSSWTDIVAVEADFYNSYGVKSDGTVVMAGSYVKSYNSWEDARRFADKIAGWTDIVDLEACNQGLFGIRSDGTVIYAEDEGRGQEYDFSEVETWTDIVQLSAGDSHVLGLKKDGTVVAAGDNKSLQCQINGF